MSEQGNSVLIVDDEVLNITALTNILNEEYTVYVTKEGEKAMQLAYDVKPDVILLDIVMPGISGFEVITGLKENEATQNIPVIFVTGLKENEDEELGLTLGAADYITKPFNESIVKLRVGNQIKMINQVRTIERLSITDALTNTSNRRHFDIRLKQEWLRSQRDGTSVSLMFLDIDNFKNVNDRYGHLFGDKILKNVADNIKHCLKRSLDVAARWGGEEFAVLLTNTPMSGALYLADEIRKTVEKRVVQSDELKDVYVTISIGVNSLVPKADSSLYDFIDKTDKSLYKAKKTGKNRVCTYDESDTDSN